MAWHGVSLCIKIFPYLPISCLRHAYHGISPDPGLLRFLLKNFGGSLVCGHFCMMPASLDFALLAPCLSFCTPGQDGLWKASTLHLFLSSAYILHVFLSLSLFSSFCMLLCCTTSFIYRFQSTPAHRLEQFWTCNSFNVKRKEPSIPPPPYLSYYCVSDIKTGFFPWFPWFSIPSSALLCWTSPDDASSLPPALNRHLQLAAPVDQFVIIIII